VSRRHLSTALLHPNPNVHAPTSLLRLPTAKVPQPISVRFRLREVSSRLLDLIFGLSMKTRLVLIPCVCLGIPVLVHRSRGTLVRQGPSPFHQFLARVR
jgi:hypothetical protein